MYQFDEARKNNISDDDIVSELKASGQYNYQFDKALQDGVSSTQIVEFLKVNPDRFVGLKDPTSTEITGVGTHLVEQPQTVRPTDVTATEPTGLALGVGDPLTDPTYMSEQEFQQAREGAPRTPVGGTSILQEFKDPQTGEMITETPGQQMQDVSLDFFFGPVGQAAGVVGTGYLASKAFRGLNKAEKASIGQLVAEKPDNARELIDVIGFAKREGVSIPKSVWRDEGIVETGNAVLDTMLINLKGKFTGVEYKTMQKLVDNISKEKITSEMASKTFQKEMNAKYDEFSQTSKQLWDEYSELSQDMMLSKGAQKSLLKDIDKAIPNADMTVKNFISRTIFKNKEEGSLTIKNLDEEATRLKNRIAQFPKKPSKAEKATKKRYESELRRKMKEIAKMENELMKKPLELSDLVSAKQAINNKMYVQGGAISTGNRLERQHLQKVNEVLDNAIAGHSDPGALEALEKARKSSKDTFSTFGYDLTGKNMGITTDMSGNVIKQQEIGAIKAFEDELLRSNPDEALAKFKKYEQLLGSGESINQAKKLYVNKLFGLDIDNLIVEPGLKGMRLNDEQLRAALNRATNSEASIRLSKNIFGEEGYKDLVAIKRMDNLLKSKIRGGQTTFWKEATSGFDSTAAGVVNGLVKLTKSLTWDIATLPFRQGTKSFNNQIVNQITRELNKEKPSHSVLGKLMRELNDKIKVAGASAVAIGATQAEAAEGDPEIEAPESPYSAINPQDFVATEQDFLNKMREMTDMKLKVLAKKYDRPLIMMHRHRRAGESIEDTLKRVIPNEQIPQEFITTYKKIYGAK